MSDTPVRRFLTTYAMARDITRKRKAEPFEDAELIAQKAIRDAQVAMLPIQSEQAKLGLEQSRLGLDRSKWAYDTEQKREEREGLAYMPGTPEYLARMAGLDEARTRSELARANLAALQQATAEAPDKAFAQAVADVTDEWRKGTDLGVALLRAPERYRPAIVEAVMKSSRPQVVQSPVPAPPVPPVSVQAPALSLTQGEPRYDAFALPQARVSVPEPAPTPQRQMEYLSAIMSMRHPAFDLDRARVEALRSNAETRGGYLELAQGMAPYKQQELQSRIKARDADLALRSEALRLTGRRTDAQIARDMAYISHLRDQADIARQRLDNMTAAQAARRADALARDAARMSASEKNAQIRALQAQATALRPIMALSAKELSYAKRDWQEDPRNPVLKKAFDDASAAWRGDVAAYRSVWNALRRLGGEPLQEVKPSGVPVRAKPPVPTAAPVPKATAPKAPAPKDVRKMSTDELMRELVK